VRFSTSATRWLAATRAINRNCLSRAVAARFPHLFLFYPLSANPLHFGRLNGPGENLFPANPKVFSCFGVYPTLSREILGYFCCPVKLVRFLNLFDERQ